MPVRFKKPAARKVTKLKNTSLNSAKPCDQQDAAEVTNKLKTLHIQDSSRQIAAEKIYIGELLKSKRYFALSKNNFYAVADCEESSTLNYTYCIVERLTFHDTSKKESLFLCSCA